ncbi:beta-1,4-galactosyltransferase 4-like [Pecten maximus]|uniref:beta-1,4-galactosyltransferase 4-like n=1 Tax=Pecten maximus TaxID=6579 RepID=UPI001458ADD6|nr:beta-1,4-galactosyltransferase 4-like [Pecten maximus]XP_033756566.1 beta-1,4-galactosyltransferase 4-like [Pecten maximus]
MCVRCIKSWVNVSAGIFWKRLLTVLLCEAALVLVFIQYTTSQRKTPALQSTSRMPLRELWHHGNKASNNNSEALDINSVREATHISSVREATHISSVNFTSYNNTIKLASNNSSTSLQLNYTMSDLPPCPLIPPGLNGKLSVDTTDYNETDLALRLPEVKFGGIYQPASCAARSKVAIIIPYRNRATHLKILLNNLHPLLQKQQLDYGIFVIELESSVKFNKAVVMNIGFLEVAKKHGYHCFIFHDVDLIPENDNNMYSCPDNPRHMSVAIDKFDYELPYVKLFGGVTAMRKEHFEAVNGYSNKYFGWGGEDDDMYERIRAVGLAVTRFTSDVSAYQMLPHHQDEKNEDRHRLLEMGSNRWKGDGLNTIKYKVLQTVQKRLYTSILATIDPNDKPFRMWTIKPRVNQPVRFFDDDVDKQLKEKAMVILNTGHLDQRLYYMLKVEFLVLNTPMVTTDIVSDILRKILPHFSFSADMIQRVNDFQNKQKFANIDMKHVSTFNKHKTDFLSNMKLSFIVNNFNENMKRMQQAVLEGQSLKKMLKHPSKKFPAASNRGIV